VDDDDYERLIKYSCYSEDKGMDEIKLDLTEGVWAIVELMGHKTLAGRLTRDEMLGQALLKLDIPAVGDYPPFTRHIHPQAIYEITYVSQEAAIMVAAELEENPVTVYVPDLGNLREMRQRAEKLDTVMYEYQRLQREYSEMQSALEKLNLQLPSGE
jgi:hypothetical protein